MARRNEADEMLLFNPGYLFRFKEKKSSKLAMEKKHFIVLLLIMTIIVIGLRVAQLVGVINFAGY